MKKILILFLAIIIVTKIPSQILPKCNWQTAKMAFVPRIFEQTTIDGSNQAVPVTRFLHNKVGIYGWEISSCYFSFLDPNFINSSIGIVGLAAILHFVYKATIKKYYLLLAFFLLCPILPFFNVSELILTLIYKIFAIIGLLFWLSK